MSFLRYSALNNGVNELEVRRFFFISPAFDTPVRGDPRRNIAIPFGVEKDGEKIEDMLSRFDRIPACDRRTDRHLRQHIPRYAQHRAVKT